LQDQYALLARKEPFDRFFPEALARVQLAAGNEKEAFASMKKAYYMSGQSSELLDELGDLASRVGDLKSAIYYRRQIIAKAGDETSIGNWNTLIEMLEKDLRVNEADLLRRRLETKFGQDPEFLTALAKHYRENNHLIAAGRVLKKLVTLRAWDVHAKMELALLENQNGRHVKAVELFNDIISRTKDAVQPASNEDSPLWPILRVPRPGTGDSSEEQLREMAISVDSFIVGDDPEDREKLTDWLQRRHPEFDYLPANEFFLRLRAIEECAAIHLSEKLGKVERENWLSQWEKDDPQKLYPETLWAMRHSAAGKPLRDYLSNQLKVLAPEKNIDRFWCGYTSLLAGGEEGL
ncbi:MAG: hypothetical protein KAG66_10025, partial [Methylococcales bacterium]|nr:hypothetical protein [Methylococcales bacterium]